MIRKNLIKSEGKNINNVLIDTSIFVSDTIQPFKIATNSTGCVQELTKRIQYKTRIP